MGEKGLGAILAGLMVVVYVAALGVVGYVVSRRFETQMQRIVR